MKLKSLLFGTAAALVAATGAQAAEPLLPVAEPVDYVRICDAFGTGFFFIPGTDTCLKIGGYVRAEFHYVHPFEDDPFFDDDFEDEWELQREFNEFTSRARARVTLDTRTQTDIGMVRTFSDLWFHVGPDDFDDNYGSTSTTLRQAFIQIANDWGTITGGRADSFFEFFEGNAWATRLGDDAPISPRNLFASTFNLGNGVSFSVAAEDAASSNSKRTVGGDGIHGGQRAPDVVANIRVDQAWGSAQVMGVLHPLRTDSTVVATSSESELGWAVGAGVSTDIPGIGWSAAVQVAYTEGAVDYVTTGGPAALTDAWFNPVTGELDLTEAWSVKAGVEGDLAPDWGWGLDGFWADVDHSASVGAPVDFEYTTVSGRVFWKPVSGFIWGVELAYENVDYDTLGDTDRWGGMMRMQRSF